jgi:hypothetical protein
MHNYLWRIIHWGNWWPHLQSWSTAERWTALATSAAATFAAIAVWVSRGQSADALGVARAQAADAHDQGDRALRQAADVSTQALEQARELAREDRRSAHRLLIYERIGEFRMGVSEWAELIAECKALLESLDAANQAGNTSRRNELKAAAPPAYREVNHAALRADQSLIAVEMMLDTRDQPQKDFGDWLAALRHPLNVATKVLAWEPFVPSDVPLVKIPVDVIKESFAVVCFNPTQIDLTPSIVTIQEATLTSAALAAATAKWALTEIPDKVRELLPPLTSTPDSGG